MDPEKANTQDIRTPFTKVDTKYGIIILIPIITIIVDLFGLQLEAYGQEGTHPSLFTLFPRTHRPASRFIHGLHLRPLIPCVESCSTTRWTLLTLLSVFLTTIDTIFENVYHEETGIAGLNYFALGIGLTGASQINACFMDRIYVYYQKKSGVGKPEYRLREWIRPHTHTRIP